MLKTMLALVALVAAASAPAQTTDAGGACARLAAQTGLKQQSDGSWRANMLGGVGAALFGGTTGATFQVQPIEGSTAEQALEKACQQEGAAIACRVSGPARVIVGTKRRNASIDLASGEPAEVGMKGRYLTCRPGK